MSREQYHNSPIHGYSDEVWEEAFQVWNGPGDQTDTTTARLLAEREAERAAEEGREPQPTPTPSAINRKSRRKGPDGVPIWERRAQEEWANSQPRSYVMMQSRMLALGPRMMSCMSSLFAPGTEEYELWWGKVKPEHIARWRVVYMLEHAKTVGYGMHGQKFARYEIAMPHDEAIEADVIEDVAASFRSRQLKAGGGE